MKRVKAKRPQLKLKPGLKDTKKVNDLIINGEHEFKQEEQYFQLSASTTSKIDRQRGDFSRVVALDNIGAPQVDRFVYSSFDSRPFNGRDTNWTLADIAYDTVSEWARAKWVVPDGYVMVFRKLYGYIRGGAPTSPATADIRATFIINGAADPYNTQVPCFGSAGASYVIKDTYVFYVLDEGDVMEVEFYSPGGSQFNNHPITPVFSGNLLPKTGVPANFEIGFDTRPMTTFKPIDKKTMYKQPKKLKK